MTVAHPLRLRMKEIFYQLVPDPVEAQIEAIYSVLIVMTFTLSVSAVTAIYDASGYEQSAWIENLFWEAFGSAVAWGIIDGFMYLTSSRFARGDQIRRFRSLRAARSEAEALELVSEEMEEMIEMIPDLQQREQLVRSVHRTLLAGKSQPPLHVGFRKDDIMGAIGTFLVAVLAALPVALPLLLLQVDTPFSAQWIIRISSFSACLMLFGLGYRWASYDAGGNPWSVGLLMALAGLALIMLTIPLGA